MVALGYQQAALWQLALAAIPLLLAAMITHALARRLGKLDKMARSRFDNPLMQLLYTNKVDNIAAIELAMLMNQAEFNAVLARTQQTCSRILRSVRRRSAQCRVHHQQPAATTGRDQSGRHRHHPDGRVDPRGLPQLHRRLRPAR